MSTCFALCIAKSFSFPELKESISARYYCSIYRDVIHIRKDPGDVFIFSYGVVVLWDTAQPFLEAILKEIKPFEQESFGDHLSDEFTFSYEGSSRVKDDHISLSSDDILERLAISHGIAQSVKLEEFELRAEKTIAETAHIPMNIASAGKSRLSRKEISMMRGSLYLAQSEINLRFNLLDTPEFFWEYPEVERFYEMMARYLDVKQRIDILNKKLEMIHELFGMLAAEQYHKHSASLEWIIILLIALEIVFFVGYEVLKGF